MSTHPNRRIAGLCTLAALAVLTFAPRLAQAQAPAQVAAKPASVTVFAASSLTNSLKAVADAYLAKTGKSVTLSFGASSALAHQIEQGAPADIFFSADVDWMDDLQKQKLIDTASRKTILGNQLVLVGATGAKPLTIAPGFDLAGALGDGKLALGDPASVPAGLYAKAALTNLGVWDKVAGHVAPAENVRVALEYVVRGEAPYGVVYATDAKVAPQVTVIGVFPENSHPPIVYPAALVKGASADARGFLDFLSSPDARAIFAKAGFKPL